MWSGWIDSVYLGRSTIISVSIVGTVLHTHAPLVGDHSVL